MSDLLQDSGVKMKSSWLDYVAFNAITFAVSQYKVRTLYYTFDELELNCGGGVQLDDPGIQALLRAIDYDLVRDKGYIDIFTDKLRASYISQGPGQFDMSQVRNLRETCDQHGWGAVDALMETLYEVSVSRVFSEPRTVIEFDDPGLDGDDCYALSMMVKVKPAQSNVPFLLEDKWRVLASRPERLIKHLVKLLDEHYSNSLSQNRSPEATPTAEWAASGIPTSLKITKNDNIIAYMTVRLKPNASGIKINWATAQVFTDDRRLVDMLAAIAPAKDANRLKGKFLEEALGL
jgi:hypothetical protein